MVFLKVLVFRASLVLSRDCLREFGETLNGPQALCKDEYLEALEELCGFLESALDVEGDHATEARTLPCCNFVLRVTLET